MKSLLYYITLLILIAVITGFLISSGNGGQLANGQLVAVCGFLILYAIGISFVGELKPENEVDFKQKYTATRAASIAGISVIIIGIIVQLLRHNLDYWLLSALVGINVTKIVSLITLNYRK